MNTGGIRINLAQLQQELIAGGIAIPNGLVLVGTFDTLNANAQGSDLYLNDANGNMVELPPNAQPIVAAHVASVPAVPSPPNIPGMIAAVQNSISIDAPTKTNLISALQGK